MKEVGVEKWRRQKGYDPEVPLTVLENNTTGCSSSGLFLHPIKHSNLIINDLQRFHMSVSIPNGKRNTWWLRTYPGET